MLALPATAGGRGRLRVAIVLAAAATLVLAAALASSAVAKPPAPPELRDTATATGDNLFLDRFSSYAVDIDASSGPSGEDPQGTASFEAGVDRFPFSGPVSCLKVTGNVAILEMDGPFPEFPGFLSWIIRLTDNGGGGRDLFEFYPVLPEIAQDLDCETGALGWFGGPLIGRAVVVDAAPGPASKDDCRGGGWARYGFQNQGLCIRSV